MTERREYKRFRVKGTESFSQCPHCPGLGPILDISLGGLSFYFEGEELPARNAIDIFFGNDLFCIRNIPCAKVRLSEQPHRVSHGVKLGRLQFGNLDHKQRSQLGHLINLSDNGNANCISLTFSS